MIEWCFYAAFNSISVISQRQFTLFMFFLGFTSTRLGSEVSCPRTLPRKKPKRILSATLTQGPWITSKTLYHRATLDPLVQIESINFADGFTPLPKQALAFKCLLYKSYENTVGKGEIARNEQFLLFPQFFSTLWRTFSHFHQT